MFALTPWRPIRWKKKPLVWYVDDLADAVVFLASTKASYITGNVISINGGLYS